LVPGQSESESAIPGQAQLQLVVFVWIYASVCEEVLTRSLLQTLVTGRDTGRGAPARFSMPVVVSGLFFGAMHLVLIDSMGPAAAVPIVLATLLGYLAARYREATGSLIPAVIVHMLFNVGGMLPGWIVGLFGR
jgi:membrane protease YdiL (CAAX protease family)